MISTSSGDVPIEEIQEGDSVWFYDTETHRLVLRRVVRLIRPPNHTVLKLTTEDEVGEQEVIRVTPEHPFWVAGKGWVASGELTPGDELFSALGRSVRVLAWEPDGEEPVYTRRRMTTSWARSGMLEVA